MKLLLFLVLSCAEAVSPTSSLRDKLQQHLDARATYFNTSFSFGLKGPDLDIALVSGVNDRATGSKLQLNAAVPSGSVTKTWTAVGIMQLVESGALALDDFAYEHADKVLHSQNGTTLKQIWGGDDTINTVTIRHLLSMRAGFNDYDNRWYETETLTRPSVDVSPFDLLHRLNKTFICVPGTCGAYSSVGYELLGLVLVQHAGVSSWQALDQKRVIPSPLLPKFADTVFPTQGDCAAYPTVCHQYSVQANFIFKSLKFQDIIQDSCVNGWTCGNIATSGSNIARFYYYLSTGQLVSEQSYEEMTHFIPLTNGFAPGLPYGLGLMNNEQPVDRGHASDAALASLIGHEGLDFGSGAKMAGYNPTMNISIALTAGSQVGMNCSLRGDAFTNNFRFSDVTGCELYQLVIDELGKGVVPPLNCSYYLTDNNNNNNNNNNNDRVEGFNRWTSSPSALAAMSKLSFHCAKF